MFPKGNCVVKIKSIAMYDIARTNSVARPDNGLISYICNCSICFVSMFGKKFSVEFSNIQISVNRTL